MARNGSTKKSELWGEDEEPLVERASTIVVAPQGEFWVTTQNWLSLPRDKPDNVVRFLKEVEMRGRLKMLYLGAMSCFLVGVILAITAAECSRPLVIGLTAGACVCFVAAAILLTIRRRWQILSHKVPKCWLTVAKAKGVDQATVSRRLKFNTMSDKVKDFMRKGLVDEFHLAEIITLCAAHNLSPWLTEELGEVVEVISY